MPFELAGRERRLHGAVRPHPLGDLEAPAARHQRLRPRGQLEAIEMRAVHPRDLEHVAEAARGDEAHRGDAPLHDGVGDGGGAVGERGAGLARPQQRAQAVEHALRAVVGHRGHLARAHLPGDVVHGDDVGEGAPHVHADAEAAHARIEPHLHRLREHHHAGEGARGVVVEILARPLPVHLVDPADHRPLAAPDPARTPSGTSHRRRPCPPRPRSRSPRSPRPGPGSSAGCSRAPVRS